MVSQSIQSQDEISQEFYTGRVAERRFHVDGSSRKGFLALGVAEPDNCDESIADAIKYQKIPFKLCKARPNLLKSCKVRSNSLKLCKVRSNSLKSCKVRSNSSNSLKDHLGELFSLERRAGGPKLKS